MATRGWMPMASHGIEDLHGGVGQDLVVRLDVDRGDQQRSFTSDSLISIMSLLVSRP